MKCVNCGGELDSQAIKCPYCGGKNQAGLAFYKEVYEKVNRNKLLAPLLLRQKTPELVQRMLTRIIIAMGMLGAVLMGISIGLFWLIDDPAYRDDQPASGSYAAQYTEIFGNHSDLKYLYWTQCRNEFLDRWNSGREIDNYRIERMLKEAFRVYYAEGMDPRIRQQACLEVDALLEGVLKLGEEERELFHKKEEQGGYYVGPDPHAQKQLVSLIEARLADREEGDCWNFTR